MEGRIPQDVLDVIAVSLGADDESRRLLWVLEAYEQRLETLAEPTYRRQLALLYCRWVPRARDQLLKLRQRLALERCAEGLPYEVEAE